MEAVGAHHQVEGARLPVREGGVHPVLVLVERGDAVAVDELDARRGVAVEDLHQVAAQQFDVLAVESAAAVGGLLRAVQLGAVGAEHGHPAHPGADGADLLGEAGPLDHVEGDAPDVDGLAAGARAGGQLDDGRGESQADQPVGEGGAGDAAAGDEDVLHGCSPGSLCPVRRLPP